MYTPLRINNNNEISLKLEDNCEIRAPRLHFTAEFMKMEIAFDYKVKNKIQFGVITASDTQTIADPYS